MAADGTLASERLPRRARYLIPRSAPRRAELVAACVTATIIAHLLFAQFTIILAVIFHCVTRVSRWRPEWLLVPAAAGLGWALAIGPGRAATGLLEGPRQVAAYLAGVGSDPARVLHLSVALRGMGGWLPHQLPLALITGAAEAALAAWLSWLHTDEWRLPPARPGLIAMARGMLGTRALRAGRVVTADGGCVGVDARTGARAGVSWAEAAGGLLCAGSPRSGTTTTSFQLVHAAIRRRKPVIAVDLAGDRTVAGWFAAVCAATDTPLLVFGPAGPGRYEPLRGGGPERRAALVAGMVDWGGTAGQYRRSCGSYLTDLFAVLDAAPGDPRTPVLDEVLHLLSPGALRARAEHVPSYHPRRGALIDRVTVSASVLENAPQAAAALSGQLEELRASAVGRWLRPAAPASLIDLDRVVRDRCAVLFSLDRAALGPAAGTVAALVAQDLMVVSGELRRIGVDGDGLVWYDQFGAVPPGVLTELIQRGSAAGMATVLTTTATQPADQIADQAGAVLMHRMTDPVTAERFARLTGEKLMPPQQSTAGPGRKPAPKQMTFVRRPVVSPEVLCTLTDGEFVLTVKAPRSRLVPLGRVIPARLRPIPAVQGAPAGGGNEREPFRPGKGQPWLAGAFRDPEQRA